MNKRIIIIGGVAGGATVASQIRRLDDQCDIVIYEKRPSFSFANCGLPYHLSHEVEDIESLYAASVEDFDHKRNIKVHLNHEVINIDTEANRITIKDEHNEQLTDTYDFLILSPGAHAKRLEVRGQDRQFVLHNIEQLEDIESSIKTHDIQNVTIIGAGYIALEAAENLKERGLNVSIINRSDQYYKAADRQFNDLFRETLLSNNIKLYEHCEVDQIDEHQVTLNDGQVILSDIVITAIGITPSTQFIQSSQIDLIDDKFIKVNALNQTSVDNVYALGDSIMTKRAIDDQLIHQPLAWVTHRDATTIAHHITNTKIDKPFQGVYSASIIRLFDLTIATVGLKESELTDEYIKIEHSGYDRAGYMPDKEKIQIIVYIDPSTHQVARASAIGGRDVSKYIDLITMSMMNQMVVEDFINIEPTYSPPYASPKSIINMIGYKAINAFKK